MGLFTKVNCAVCGQPANVIMRVKLRDGNFICSECSRIIPYYAYQSYLETYTLEDYFMFKEYRSFSDRELRPIFEESDSYYDLHLDNIQDLFYIGPRIDKNTIFFRLQDVVNFELIFKPKEAKGGITGQKVEGDVLLQIEVRQPYFKFEAKLAKDVKAKAKKELFGAKVTYENPKGMDAFLAVFIGAWTICQDDGSGYESADQPTELQQAMALFMLDSMDGVTLNDLKAHRNRMIKAFHPDKGGTDGTRYAQKINNAYEVLKLNVEKNS